jgi:two-component system, LytTR family, sensor kinase
MLKTQRFYWLAQIGGWGMLSLLILLASLSIPNPEINLKVTTETVIKSSVCFFISGVLISHLMRSLFVRLGWLEYKFGPLVPRMLLLSLLSALVMEITDVAYSYLIIGNVSYISGVKFFLEMFVHFLFFLLWNGIYLSFHFFQRSRVQEVKNLQLSASQKEIELKNLRSQLNPHFLFNSLNSIRALVDINPLEAKESITTLSNLLRKSLILGKEQLIPLRSELDLINDYLELEKIRFEERIHVDIQHDKTLDDLQIPPFILQTLVENAFKHGIARLVEGGTISIRTARQEEGVRILVENDGTLGAKTDTGIGLRNTIRRLELQYDGKANFQLSEKNKKVTAKIEINAVE